jgi:hypothetical protein
MPTPKTPTRKAICARCCEYAGPGADGLGTCYLHNLMRFPFDSCEHFKREVPDGYPTGKPPKD